MRTPTKTDFRVEYHKTDEPGVWRAVVMEKQGLGSKGSEIYHIVNVFESDKWRDLAVAVFQATAPQELIDTIQRRYRLDK